MTDIDPLESSAIERELGGLRRRRNGSVEHPENGTLINRRGQFRRPLSKSLEYDEKCRRILWQYVGPLRYGDIIFERDTKVWNQDREEWWVAETVTIDDQGVPELTFSVLNSEPTQQFVLSGSQVADIVEDGTLQSKSQMQDQMSHMLDG